MIVLPSVLRKSRKTLARGFAQSMPKWLNGSEKPFWAAHIIPLGLGTLKSELQRAGRAIPVGVQPSGSPWMGRAGQSSAWPENLFLAIHQPEPQPVLPTT